jgi:ABC-type transport system substrate-binding protein
MKKNFVAVLIALFALALLGGCSSQMSNVEAANAQPTSESKGLFGGLTSQPVVVPAGTPITVRLQNSISSATAVPGQSFDFTLVEPLVIDGKTVAPAGAAGQGRVIAARQSGRLHNAGYLRVGLASIGINGKQVPVQSSSIFVSGGRYAKRNVAYIGGGAGAGALIGAIAGGGKGALIGSAIGAGAGTGAAYATGKKEVGFAAERSLTFKLTQPLSVTM